MPADLDSAQQYFELALKKDPDYAQAYTGISFVWIGRQQMGFASPSEAGPKAKAAALKAMALDDNLAEAHYALGCIRVWSDWDWTGAEPEFKRAIELNPSFPDARAFYSHLLNFLQRPTEALPQMERALELDPFNVLFHALYGTDLLYMRRFDDAIVQVRRALQTVPDHPVANEMLWMAYIAKGMEDEALATVKVLYNSAYSVREVAEALDRGYEEGGYRIAMRRAADALTVLSRTKYVKPTDVANLYIGAGDTDRAIEWLEKGVAARDPNMPYIGLPYYDSLRAEPRFQALLRRMNLPSKEIK
jgi:adenylate cyclase